jgi:RNA polymerase sigma factor (sigma-70 family)
MATSPLNTVIQHFLADFGPDGGGMTDGELLGRFLSSRDDNALAALVRRHAPMVWGVCCRLLPNHHDAEDAFQATFLVLVRKAADVPRQAVANWLYGVARQTAVRLRALSAKRRRRESQVMNMPEPTVAEVRDADLQSELEEELSRLPDHYRGVVVLCDLEGMTRKEAARQLAIPEGSVASRLARARVLLAKRLTRRGVVFSGGTVAAVLSAGPASASPPPALVASTIKAASLLVAGRAVGVVSAKVAALTEGVVKTMFVTKIKSVLALVLVVAALAGAAGLIYQTQAGEQPMAKEEQLAAKKDQKTGEEKQAQPKQQPAKSDQERMVGNWFIMNDDSMRKGEMWVIDEDRILMHAKNSSPITNRYFHRLDAGKDPKQIDITVTPVNGPPVGIIKGIYLLDGDELRLCLADMGKDRPAAFAKMPGPGEVLILQRNPLGTSPPKAKEEQPAAKKEDQKKAEEKPATKEEKLRALVDKVPAAHGGEDKLNKLTSFTMTVKHSNGETQHYFVQPPRNFRWETTHPDRTGKRIVILFPEGRRWWTKEPNEDAKEFIPTGIEPPVEFWLDYVKFFGPRQVLRLKDADHKVTLLDEEAKIGDRAAVGVQVTGPRYNQKMYFDKETHLLLKGFGVINREVTYSDYKKFDGIPIAQKEHDGHFEPEVTDFRAVEKFDAKLFEQP